MWLVSSRWLLSKHLWKVCCYPPVSFTSTSTPKKIWNAKIHLKTEKSDFKRPCFYCVRARVKQLQENQSVRGLCETLATDKAANGFSDHIYMQHVRANEVSLNRSTNRGARGGKQTSPPASAPGWRRATSDSCASSAPGWDGACRPRPDGINRFLPFCLCVSAGVRVRACQKFAIRLILMLM